MSRSLSNAILTFVIIVGLLALTVGGYEEDRWESHRYITKVGWNETSRWFDNPTSVYAFCIDEKPVFSKRDCMIIYYKDIYDKALTPRQCTFKLNKASHGIVSVKSMANERVLFVWASDIQKNHTLHWTFNMAVIDMPSCRIFTTDLVIDTKPWDEIYGPKGWHLFYVDTLIYEDGTFDVCLLGVEVCGDAVDDINCVYTYDNDANLIEGPFTLYTPSSDVEYYMFLQISRESRDKGYLFYSNQRHVLIVKKIGQWVSNKVLWKLPLEKEDRSRTSYAFNNDLITFCTCATPTDEIHCICLQSNHEGDSKRQMEVVLENLPGADPPRVTLMHNLRGGGFFIMPLYTDMIEDEHFYAMTKVDADGRVVGEPYVIGGHSNQCFADYINTRFIELDDGQYCITLACDQRHHAVLRTLTQCYTPRYLNANFLYDHDEL